MEEYRNYRALMEARRRLRRAPKVYRDYLGAVSADYLCRAILRLYRSDRSDMERKER